MITISLFREQIPGFNRGYWSDFELFIRHLVVPREDAGDIQSLVSRRSLNLSPPFRDVYVITGPLYLPTKEVVHLKEGGYGIAVSRPVHNGLAGCQREMLEMRVKSYVEFMATSKDISGQVSRWSSGHALLQTALVDITLTDLVHI